MRILIAEDDPVSRRLLQARLEKWGYDVLATTDGEEALSILLAEDAPAMAVLDWMMPKVDGLAVCRRVRSERPKPYTYIVLLTAKGATDDLVAGMQAGADDYVVKPFDAHELQVRIRAGRRILELERDLTEARDKLQFQATHDPLTGTWNRAAITEMLQHELARAAREEIPVSVIMTDIDHFKRVNDEHGHLAGDAVLREVVRRMQTAIRVYDEVGRYGGEEFLVVTPNNPAAAASEIAERIRALIEKTPFDISGGLVPVTASFGVAGKDGGIEVEANTLIGAADAALYRAKEEGRNRVVAAAPDACKA